MALNKPTVALCSTAAVVVLALAAAGLLSRQPMSGHHDQAVEVPGDLLHHLPGHLDINQVLAALPR